MKKSFLNLFKEIIETVVISVAIVLLVRTFLFQPFFVKGESMLPNFSSGDYLIVDEITPRLSGFERGDVIVFRNPNSSSIFFIKRIIGLPEERIVIKEGKIYIYNKEHPTGFQLKEPYLTDNYTPGNVDITLKKNQYFVLGDNRKASYDSRAWGPLEKSDIIGIVRLRAWPPKALAIFTH